MANGKEEKILLSLVQGPDGEMWTSDATRLGWESNSNIEVCQWDGIECDSHKNIIAIALASSGLSASLPSQLGGLTSLKKIRLEMNSIHGIIPHELASLPHLEVLNLSENKITGNLPQSFASSKLQILALRSNGIKGLIPSNLITATSSCQAISLSKNLISGTIPSSFYQLSILDTLDLSSNLISGTISESIGDLMFLQDLRLDNNTLIGSIPSSIAKPNPLKNNVGDLLEQIWLNDNQLSGTIPIQLSDLPNLRSLYLHNNKLTGEIPHDICSEFLNANFFRNAPLDHDKNYCDAVACPADHSAIENAFPCTRCFSPHFNPYIGQWGACVENKNQRDILETFHIATSVGGDWTDGEDGGKGNNWMDKLTFICDFTGVTCDHNNHVVKIKLSNRGLHGTLPDDIGFLPYLEVLDVSDNNLSGLLPSDLRWAPLKLLDISGNRIKGVVPPSLCAKRGLNSNGVANNFDCYNVACPAGLYSPIGRRDLTKDEDCLPCHHLIPSYLGFKGCERSGTPSNVFGFIFALATFGIAIIIFLVVYYCFRRKMKYGPRNTEVGIALYEFSGNKKNESSEERDKMMDEYVATTGRSAGTGEMLSPYSDVPKPRLQTTEVSKVVKKSDEKSVDGSISSRSTRSSGSRRSAKSKGRSQSSVKKKAYKPNQDIRQPADMKRTNQRGKADQKFGGSDDSNKGDTKVWLDVPVV